jgi:endonuclease/exonuclease/phosphatase family metal-dependent hydrolase
LSGIRDRLAVGRLTLRLLVNHLKSKGFGATVVNNARRKAQATKVREIYQTRLAAGATFVAILGDLNDTPDSDPLSPLLGDGVLRDISLHPGFQSDGRFGTWKNGAKSQKLDYIILSPALWDRVTAGGVERRGVWGGAHGTLFPHLPEITEEVEAASDHAAIWVDLNL